MFTKIIAFSIALIPFFCWQGWEDGIRTPKEIASVISLAIIIVAGFLSYPIKKAFNKYFFIFLGWCIVTLFFSNYSVPKYVQGAVIGLPSNLIAYKSIVYAFLAIFSIQVIYSSDIDLKLISKTITLVTLVLCVYSFIQLLGLDEWFMTADPNTGWVGKGIWDRMANVNNVGHYSRRLVGTIGNPSILAIFLSMCIPFCLLHGNLLGRVTAIIAIVVIGLTLSLTAYISTTVSLLFLLFFKSKKVAMTLLIICILSGIGVSRLPQVKFMLNPTGRIEMLKESFNILNKKAITGMGLGTFEYLVGMNPEIVKRLNNENWREEHTEYGQIWFETGLVGLILVMMGLFGIFRTFRMNLTRDTIHIGASFLVFLVVSLTYFPMRIAPSSFYGVIILGLLYNKMGDVK